MVLNNAVYEDYELKDEEQAGDVAEVDSQAVPGVMVEPQMPPEESPPAA